ncbi:hypothetical protein V6N11_069906 [Hibiscus sabdariffa]|uniref:Uncharacterized protein n=1 Tax=Hibiscus sabdariffa TaxID=183260 RepID=A0ABR2NH38_9ROSI
MEATSLLYVSRTKHQKPNSQAWQKPSYTAHSSTTRIGLLPIYCKNPKTLLPASSRKTLPIVAFPSIGSNSKSLAEARWPRTTADDTTGRWLGVTSSSGYALANDRHRSGGHEHEGDPIMVVACGSVAWL